MSNRREELTRREELAKAVRSVFGHMDERAVTRFWACVVKTDGCWMMTLKPSPKGYATFGVKVDGKWFTALAHRVSYELVKGPIPSGLHLDHLCRNRACVNPDHLEPVAQRTNTLRGVGISAVNAHKTTCNRGHAFTPENTIISVRKCGTHRACRECKAAQAANFSRRYRAKRRALASHCGGRLVEGTKRLRAKNALARKVCNAYSSPQLVRAIDDYDADKAVQTLVQKFKCRVHEIVIGEPPS